MKHGNEKISNKSRVAKYILKSGGASKPEIAGVLELSMPTVLQVVKSLMDEGLITESGKQESNGGRKATALTVAEDICCAAGIDITANHMSYVLIDLCGNIKSEKRIKRPFENTPEYYREVNANLEDFLDFAQINVEKLIGVGVSLPGIIDKKNKVLVRSHILNQNNVSLKSFSDLIRFDTAFENDANNALFAEMSTINRNTVYLSLSNSLGGAICIDGAIYGGDGFKSAEFGHMIIEPNGRQCYCGKYGCADAYCSARVLLQYADSLDEFFLKLKHKETEICRVWNEYLDYLPILISNLRMAFDCDIMLGGYVGGYLKDYMGELTQKVRAYNLFDSDTMYLKNCRYEREASAVGAAMYFTEHFLDTL